MVGILCPISYGNNVLVFHNIFFCKLYTRWNYNWNSNSAYMGLANKRMEEGPWKGQRRLLR